MHIPTIEEVIQPYTHLPKIIQQAILRIETHPSFSVLTKASRAVLRQIITRADKMNAYVPVKANLDRLAQESGCHYRTVQRALSCLYQAGFVTRITDGRGEFGLWSSNQFRISRQLAAIAGLKYLEEGEGATADSPDPVNEIEAFYEKSIEVDRREISDKNRNKIAISLPDGLLEIEGHGLNKYGICRLRGHACNRGHDLLNVWLAAKDYVVSKKIQGGRLYKYLIAMIVKNVDYKARALQASRIDATTKAGSASQDAIRKAEAIAESIAAAEKKKDDEIASIPKGRGAAMQALMELKKGLHEERADDKKPDEDCNVRDSGHNGHRESPLAGVLKKMKEMR